MTIKITQKENKPEVSIEILAQSIEAIAKFGKELKNSRLKEKTILILIQSVTGLARADIKAVLDALPQLEAEFLKPKAGLKR